jgi:DHA2 family multidrug resistance protein
MSAPTPDSKAAALTGATLWTTGILLAGANFLAVLDMTIANVSVPNISGGLGASTSQGTWVLTSYSVAEAIIVPLTGWLAARFGTVRIFITAMIGFGICSALCSLSTSLGMLVFCRVLQGCTGGPLLPLSQTLLLQIFPKKQQLAALGLWAMTTLIAPIAGPILGGQLCDNWGWPSIFWVNVPIAFLCAPVLFLLLKSSETATMRKRVDFVGLALLIVAVGSLQIMLDLGKDDDWFESSTICTLAITCVIGFAAFFIWELTESEPIVALKVFRHRGFATSMVTMGLVFGAFYASNVLTPLWLQSNMGYTATWAGYASGMMGVLALVLAPPSALLSSKVDPRKLIFVGVTWLAAVVFWRGEATSQMAFWQIAMGTLLTGIGLPLFVIPINSMALASVDPEETASASGLLNFIRTVSGAFGTSIANTIWENGATRNQSDLAAMMTNAQGTIDQLTKGGMSHDQAVSAVTQIAQGQAIMLSTDQLFIGCALLFFFAAVTIWLAPKPARITGPSFGH